MMRFGVRGKRGGARRGVAASARSLGTRSIVLVGMPGCGKSAVGRRLAARLELAVRRCRRGDRAGGRQAHQGDLRGPRRGLFPRRRAQGDRAPAARRARRCWRPAAAPSWSPRRATTSADSGISVWLKAELPRAGAPRVKTRQSPAARRATRRASCSAADGDALSRLRNGRHHGGKPRRAARRHRRRDHRRAGAEPAAGRRRQRERSFIERMLRRAPSSRHDAQP